MKVLVFTCYLLLNVLNIQGQVTVNISPQQDYNASFNGDMLIQFNCISTEEVFVWRVNNTIPNVNNELAEKGLSLVL